MRIIVMYNWHVTAALVIDVRWSNVNAKNNPGRGSGRGPYGSGRNCHVLVYARLRHIKHNTHGPTLANDRPSMQCSAVG